MICYLVESVGLRRLREYRGLLLRQLIASLVELARRHQARVERVENKPSTLFCQEQRVDHCLSWYLEFDSVLEAEIFLLEFQRRKDAP